MQGDTTDSVLAVIPEMRRQARVHHRTAVEADDTVARALERAIGNIEGFGLEQGLRTWLFSHLDTELAASLDACRPENALNPRRC